MIALRGLGLGLSCSPSALEAPQRRPFVARLSLAVARSLIAGLLDGSSPSSLILLVARLPFWGLPSCFCPYFLLDLSPVLILLLLCASYELVKILRFHVLIGGVARNSL